MKNHRFLILLPLLLAACTHTSTMANHTVEDRNKQIIRTYFNEAWNKGNLGVLDSILDLNYINHAPSTPNPQKGPAGLKPIIMAIRAGFPDLHYEIKDIIVTRDRVVARVIMTGTQTGTLFGVAPTGKHIEVNQINIEKIENGKITEHWRVTDELTLMKQLGVVK